jgi:hypothetical protein
MPDDLVRFQRFHAFICYNGSNAKPYAEIVNSILSLIGMEVFVAHLKRNTYSEYFDRVRQTVIDSCKYFIFINTYDALNREQIVKEFKMAYPNGLTEMPKPIVIRYSATDVQYSNPEFERATGFSLNDFNQASFTNYSEFVKVVIALFDKQFDQAFKPRLKCLKPKLFDNEKTIFCGREQELSELIELLSSEKQSITLVGEGGIGKSALAFKAIHRCENKFDCIIQVPLDSRITYSKFLTIIGRGLGIENELATIEDEKTRAQVISDLMSRIDRGLIFYDGYESISDHYDDDVVPENVKQINSFLEGVLESSK